MSKAFEHFNLERVESVCLGANFNNIHSQMMLMLKFNSIKDIFKQLFFIFFYETLTLFCTIFECVSYMGYSENRLTKHSQ